MRESETAEVAGVPERVLDELAQTLAEKLDVLLDRLTDRALTVPDAGTPAWRQQWMGRDSDTGRQQHARRVYIRAVLASRAGIGLAEATAPIRPEPASTPPPRARTARRRSVDSNQLAIF
ncbi:hypothetical protein CH299_27685 [Rhodococcus sp. 14-2686-1-2]|nr:MULTISPECIES: hypothetical protein [unclassified Rhodococcus (in: high G+C Gram-positive bacteria)]OZE93550.1 hypothetical protein CH301_27165 [Rhodococcus sp. 15-1189-1-1a]OZF08476.1 hypothetical protein CH299_27685 [Rhodococcus sp. 14-2686-1-2]